MGNFMNLQLRAQTATITTDGSGNGSATLSNVLGEVFAVKVTLGVSMVSAPLTLTNDSGQTVLTKTISSNGVFNTGSPITTNDGTTAITGAYARYINAGGAMTATVASGTANRSLAVTVYYR